MAIGKPGLMLWCLWLLIAGGEVGCGKDEGDRVTGGGVEDSERLRATELLLRPDDSVVVLLLRPDGQALLLPMDYCESTGVYMQLVEESFFRPLTHDLVAMMSDSLGVRVQRVELDVDAQGASTGTVTLRRGGEMLQQETAAGYGLALAMRTGGEIWGMPRFLAEYAPGASGDEGAAKAPAPQAPEPSAPPAKPAVQEWVDVNALGILQGFGLEVVLMDVEQQVVLSIGIGSCEAVAIYEHLHGEGTLLEPPFDLLSALLKFRGVQVSRVRVTRFEDNVFFGEVELRVGKRSIAVDARPSDAIALALASGAPIQVADEVLQVFGADPAPYLDIFGL